MKKHLSSELYNQVVDSLGDDFDFDYIPRSRLNEVIKQRNDLRQQIDVLQDETGDNTEPKAKPDDKSDPKPAGKDNSEELEKLKSDYEKKIESVRIQYALTDALRSEGCNNPALLIPQLESEQIKLNDKGELEGYKEQVDAWKKSDPYLFKDNSTEEGGTGATGIVGSGSGSGKGKHPLDAALEAEFGKDYDK